MLDQAIRQFFELSIPDPLKPPLQRFGAAEPGHTLGVGIKPAGFTRSEPESFHLASSQLAISGESAFPNLNGGANAVAIMRKPRVQLAKRAFILIGDELPQDCDEAIGARQKIREYAK